MKLEIAPLDIVLVTLFGACLYFETGCVASSVGAQAPIRTRVDPQIHAAAEKAFDYWETQVGYPLFVFASTDESDLEIKWVPQYVEPYRGNSGMTFYGVFSVYIEIYTEDGVTIPHELGHALGLQHIKSPSVMSPSANDFAPWTETATVVNKVRQNYPKAE